MEEAVEAAPPVVGRQDVALVNCYVVMGNLSCMVSSGYVSQPNPCPSNSCYSNSVSSPVSCRTGSCGASVSSPVSCRTGSCSSSSHGGSSSSGSTTVIVVQQSPSHSSSSSQSSHNPSGYPNCQCDYLFNKSVVTSFIIFLMRM